MLGREHDAGSGGATPTDPVQVDFFISYAGVDQSWAEWIAWVLEEAGFTTVIQAWDFGAGSHFVGEMHQAAQRARRTLAVLSSAYLDSAYGEEEWQAAWAADQQGRDRTLLALRIEDCPRPGLLRQLVTVDVFGLDRAVAASRLLAAAGNRRAKPTSEPRYPGQDPDTEAVAAEEPRFPGLPALWNVPARNVNFTGRERLLQHMHNLLNASSTQGGAAVAVTALKGMGGVGKTQLVIEYAWRHAADYDLVWWVDSEQSVLLAEKISVLAGRMGLPSTGAVADDAAAVLAALRRRNRWLLIFDNASSAADVRPWLPGGPGHVTITSRSSLWGDVAARVHVDVLPRTESVTMLRRRIMHMDDSVAGEIAEELGDLPLALAQATAYLERTDLSPSNYLSRFRARREQMLRKGEDLTYGGRVDTVWSIALERLAKIAPATVQLLQLVAFLAPEPVPLSLFVENFRLLPEPLRGAAAGTDPDLDIDEVAAAALDFSLARRHGESIQMHRLVQGVIRLQLPVARWAALTDAVAHLLVAAHPGELEDPKTWPAWATLGPHLLHVAASVTADDQHGLRRQVDLFCWNLHARGDLKGARSLAGALYEQRVEQLGKDHPDTMAAANIFAVTLSDLGELKWARELFEDTLGRRRRLLGDDHAETLTSANGFALALYSLGELASARSVAEDTLARRRRILGDNHTHTLSSASNLAVILRSLGDPRGARELDDGLLARERLILGDDHPDTMASVSNLALDMAAIGDYEEARRLDEETLDRRRRVVGDDHPHTLASANNLAAGLGALGDLDAARSLNQETLDRRRRFFGDDHPDTLASAVNLSADLVELGLARDAQRILEDVLERGGPRLGRNHPTVLTAANNLVSALFALGKQRAAKELAEDTLASRREILGESHPSSLMSASNLAILLFALGENRTAVELAESTLASRREILGEGHPDTVALAAVLRTRQRECRHGPWVQRLREATLSRRWRVSGEITDVELVE